MRLKLNCVTTFLAFWSAVQGLECDHDSDMFKCADGLKCIPLKKKCDFSPDCLDGSDEPPDCPARTTCAKSQFRCEKSNKCISLDWVCDNEPDCGSAPNGTLDLSDEDLARCRGNVTCSGNQFMCKDGITCLHLSQFCDYKVDCPDNSDEGHQCKHMPSCRKMSCSHNCSVTWNGPKCYCSLGLIPQENQCEDLNECENNEDGSYCDQNCSNSNGSFSCYCMAGYMLQSDGRSCKAINFPTAGEKPTLIFANSKDIRQVNLNGSRIPKGLIKTQETLALDFVHRNHTVCWVSHESNEKASLECAKIDHLENRWAMPDPDMYSIKTVNQIAVDWAANNWYFLDDTRELIMLCALQESFFICKTILSVKMSKPRGIGLDPNEGLLFFTVWGSEPAKLERSTLDGDERRVLIDTKIVYPYGLTVDYPRQRIYWVDTYLDYIECIDYNGNNRRTLLRGSPVQNLYSASVFENSLYLTSWRNNSVLRVNKFHPEDHTTIVEGLERPFAIQVFHRQRQPLNEDSHPCSLMQRQCDHVRHLEIGR